MEQQKRSEGFYWVRQRDEPDWEIAYWGHRFTLGPEWGWQCIGFDYPLNEQDIAEIGEMIPDHACL